MRGRPDTTSIATPTHNTAGNGSASVITLASDPDQTWVIDFVGFSYAAAPTAGNLEILDVTNNTVLMEYDITAGGPGHIPLPDRGLSAPKGSAVTITLADGTQTKHLNVQYR